MKTLLLILTIIGSVGCSELQTHECEEEIVCKDGAQHKITKSCQLFPIIGQNFRTIRCTGKERVLKRQ